MGGRTGIYKAAPLGMTFSHPQQTGDRFLRDFHEPGRGPDATAVIQMVDDVLRGKPGQNILSTGAEIRDCVRSG